MQLPYATSLSNYSKQLPYATFLGNYPKQLPYATTLCNFPKQLPQATLGSVAEVMMIGWREAQDGLPDQSNNLVGNPLLEGEPVKNIQHTDVDLAEFGAVYPQKPLRTFVV